MSPWKSHVTWCLPGWVGAVRVAVLCPGTERGFLPSRVKVWISLSSLRTVIVPPALTAPGIVKAKSLILTASVAALPAWAGGFIGMLEPVGIDMGDAAGAGVGAPAVGVGALDVGWVAEPTDEVDGVLEHATARLTSARTGSSRAVRWRLMAVSRVKGEGQSRWA